MALALLDAACGSVPVAPPRHVASATPFEALAASSTPRPASPSTPSPTLTSVPSLSPTPTAACEESEGNVVEDEYPGVYVDAEIPVLVYLPPCYEQSGAMYPVLYLLHGKPFDENHWPSLGIVTATDEQIDQDDLSGYLMVMPKVPEPLFSSTDGGPRSYEAEMTNGLMPYIEDKYRVIRSPAARAIGGISRGGVWSLEIGLHRPDLFGTVIAFSPALAVNQPREVYDPLYMASHDQNFPSRFFLVAGTTDWARPDTVRLAGILANQPTQSVLKIVTGGHDAGTWERAMPLMVQFVVDGWPASH